MTNKERFFELVEREKSQLQSFGVKQIGLFGSTLRGDDTDQSDIDVLVSFEKGTKTYKNFIAVVDLLESSLGRTVELVTTESLSPYIGPKIKKEVEYAPFVA